MLRESDARLVCILASSVGRRPCSPVSVGYRIVPDELGGRDLWNESVMIASKPVRRIWSPSPALANISPRSIVFHYRSTRGDLGTAQRSLLRGTLLTLMPTLSMSDLGGHKADMPHPQSKVRWSATLLSAEAGPANVTTSATRAVGVVATMVWHAPSRPCPDCFRDARMDEVVTSWFG
jgi:hypothetical protein